MKVKGPWLGVEERTHLNQPGHSRCAINVDFSNGYIEPREGFMVVGAATLNEAADIKPDNGQVFIFESVNEESFVFVAGYNAAEKDVYLDIFDIDGRLVSSINLTDTHGEPQDKDWQCNIFRVPHKKERNVVLIVTPHNSYIWKGTDKTSVRKAKMGGGSEDDNIAAYSSWFYWTSTPKGTIAEWHRARMYYSGFGHLQQFDLSSSWPDGQNALTESILSVDRTSINVTSQHIAFSDPFDPLGIRGGHEFGVDSREKITGMVSVSDMLLVFTDVNIWAVRGDLGAAAWNPNAARIDLLVPGIGCVSHKSIVATKAGVFFAGVDGIYMFAEGSATKISSGVDSLFTNGIFNQRLPGGNGSVPQELLSTLGYPFKADKNRLNGISAVDISHKNQVWFGIPVEEEDYSLILVLNYKIGAWSYYVRLAPGTSRSGALAFTPSSIMSDAAYAVEGKEPVIYTTGGNKLYRYGGGIDAQQTPGGRSHAVSIPIYWESSCFEAEDEHHIRHLRFSMFPTGDYATKPTWFVEGVEPIEGRRSTGTMPTHFNHTGKVWGDDWG